MGSRSMKRKNKLLRMIIIIMTIVIMITMIMNINMIMIMIMIIIIVIIIIIINNKLQGIFSLFFLTNVLQTLCRFQGFGYRRASGSVRFARRSVVGWILLLEKVGSAHLSRNTIKHF